MNDSVNESTDEWNENNHEAQHRAPWLKGTFPCKYGCGFEGTPAQLSAHYRTAHKPQATSREEPPSMTEATEATLSTEADTVRDILKALKYDKVDAFIRMVDLRGYNILSLYQSAKDIGMPFSVMRPLISFWASYKAEPIPPNIQKELNIQPMPSFGPSPYGPSAYPYEQPQPRQDLTIFNALIEWERLKKETQTQPQMAPQNNEAALLREELNRLREEYRQQLSQMEKMHREEVEQLREELRKKEQERLESEIRSLEDQIRRLETQGRADFKDDAFRLLAISLAHGIDYLKTQPPLKTVLDKAPELISLAQGMIPPEKAQQIPSEKRVGLIQILRERGLTTPS